MQSNPHHTVRRSISRFRSFIRSRKVVFSFYISPSHRNFDSLTISDGCTAASYFGSLMPFCACVTRWVLCSCSCCRLFGCVLLCLFVVSSSCGRRRPKRPTDRPTEATLALRDLNVWSVSSSLSGSFRCFSLVFLSFLFQLESEKATDKSTSTR